MNLEDIDRALGPVDGPVAPAEPVALMEPVVPIEPFAPSEPVAPIEPGTSWRDALSAWGRPSGDHVSDEDIFAILNGGSDGVTPDELCAALGVTLPMYCVWKSKYRKLELDQLRQARRSERRRRHTVIGLVVLTVVLLTGGIGATLVRAVSATFKESSAATAVASDREPLPSSSMTRPSPAPATVREVRAVERRSVPDAAPIGVATPASLAAPVSAETGYRIQVMAAQSEPEGQATVARLKEQGFPAYVMPAVVGNREVFRVRVGPFDTQQAAAGMATQLKAAGYGGVWVTK